MTSYPRMARLRDAQTFREHIEQLGIELPFDEQVLSGEASPLAQPYILPNGRLIGNRFCTSPMEGWCLGRLQVCWHTAGMLVGYIEFCYTS